MQNLSRRFKKPLAIFKANHGLLRTSQALKLGIHPTDLYAMKVQGVIETMGRGLYRLSSSPALAEPDLAAVALRIPQGIICLISALAFHNLTSQVPHEVYVALRFPSRKPKLDYPPTRFAWLSSPAFEAGVETHNLDGVFIRVYSPEKTVADCFKFRNKIGLDVVLEALKRCRARKRTNVQALLRYAKIDRVEKVMKPYLEAVL